jgi:hypothetical protein
MSKIQAWFFISTLAGLSALIVLVGSVVASPATNVGLIRFEAIALDNAVRLEWETETELETAGFMLKRGQNGSFVYVVDPDGAGNLFILSEGGPAFGSSYAFTDEMVNNSEEYTYQLIEIETSGDEIVHSEITVTAGIIPTNTPIVLSSGVNSSPDDLSVTATETGTPQATVSPSATPSPESTEILLIRPSSTPWPTITVARTDVAAEITQDNNVEQAVNVAGEQPSFDETRDGSDNDENGAAVAFAQEDPEPYPGEESITATPMESINNESGVESIEELPETGEIEDSPAAPEVIGATPYPLEPASIEAEPAVINSGSANSTTSLMGKMYLWVAFLAALTIFIAAALGAILLYTRQRSKE